MKKPAHPPLVRAMGLFSLTLIAINGMVGAGIFVLPAQVAAIMGPASLWAYLAAGLATALIVICFAEVGALFERSGGPYLYARTAFGNFVGFEMGLLMLTSRLTALAAISNAFASYLGFFWPAASAGAGRVFVISACIGGLGAINFRGVKYGAWANNLLTISKLVPLLVFIGAGVFFLDSHRPPAWILPEPAGLRQAGLLLIFAFGGFEFAVVPGEEVVNPKRNVPIALLTAIAFVVVLYLMIQFVAQGTLPDLATSVTPLASASRRFLGPFGGFLLGAGGILSTIGTNGGNLLVTPRVMFAMAEAGQLPSILARVHPHYRTPYIAVAVTTLVGWAFAVSSQFTALIALSAIARLLYYMATCLALPVFRRTMPDAERRFSVPGGAIIPIAAAAMSVWLLLGSTKEQVTLTAASLLAGAVLFAALSYRDDRRPGVRSALHKL